MPLLMYSELAPWWPLLSPPDADYAEEALLFAVTIDAAARAPVRTILELGSGGGNVASYLKSRYDMTLVDLSPQMQEVSRELNPGCEHVLGDMRSVRLGRTFDAVFVHDAIMYMTTEDELAAVFETAAAHLRPGGVGLFVPDDTAETFRAGTSSGGSSRDGRSLRYLMWTHPPSGTRFRTTFTYVLEEGSGERILQEHHEFGLFPRERWLRLIEAAGFEARAVPHTHSSFTEPKDMFLGIRR